MINLFIDCVPRVLDLFWNSVNLCLSQLEEEPVSTENQEVSLLLTNG